MSGKSHDRAGAAVEYAFMHPDGARILCAREVQKSLRESAKALIEDKIEEFKAPGFRVLDDEIRTPRGGKIVFVGMNKQNSDSIKSYEGFDVAWVEEAHNLSAVSLALLRPTIRKKNSELWFTWNPRRRSDPVDKFFRGPNPPKNSIIIQANWSDNPFFPEGMEEERLHDLNHSPTYRHVWEGEYATVVEGAYYANNLATCQEQGRICDLVYDPLLESKAYWDIGIDDAMTIWVTQRFRQHLRFMDYIEGSGQPLEYYVNQLRRRGHAESECVLPHDGAHRNAVTGKKFSDHLKEAGFRVRVRKGGGPGAAVIRIEASRRLFPRCWFNDEATLAGREALGAYHERVDTNREIGLGPEHDWSCFTGETEVLTRDGKCQIKDLYNGEVLTPCGYKPFKRLGITGRNAPLVEVRFTDGSTVRCTPEHKFLTDGGWKSAEFLTNTMLIQSSLTHSRNISMGACIAFGLAKNTFQKAARLCTGRYGQRLLGKFLQDVISTIKTASMPIILWRIWNASRQENTLALAGENMPRIARFISQKTHGIVPPSGIDQKREGYGTGETQLIPKAGQSGKEKKDYARIALNHLRHWLGETLIQTSTAPAFAKPLHIESVKRLNERADVWCIQVDDGHWFTLSNGAVVHNSHGADSFGLACLDYEDPRDSVRPPSGGASMRSADDTEGWMA